jgi:hypothetical protein
MLAAVALIWIFVLIVVVVTWLQRRGRLGEAIERSPFRGIARCSPRPARAAPRPFISR